MAHEPVHTLRMASRAARRAFLKDLTFGAGRGLSVGCVVAVVLLGSNKLGLRLPDWTIIVGGCLGLGLISAGLWAATRRWSVMRSAEELDRRLGLKDRLSTAVALAGSGPSREPGPFATWAIADAEHIAPTLKIEEAIRARLDWTWGAWPVLAAAAIGVALFVPQLPHRALGSRPEPTGAEREQAAAQLRQTADAIRQGLRDDQVPAATTAQLKALEELRNELSQGRVDPEQAQVRAAKEVEDLAQRIESDAAANQHAADALREQLARAAAEKDQKAGESKESLTPLMDAIQRGDVKTAAESLAEAARSEPTMNAQEREQMARDLDQLAQAIGADKQGPAGATPPDSPDRPSGQEPANSPTKPAADPQNRTPDSATPQAVPDSAGNKTPNSPSEQSEDRKQDQSPPTTPEAQQRERLRDALRDAARDLRREQEPKSAAPEQNRENRPSSGPSPSRPGESQNAKPDESARGQPSPGQGPEGATGDQKAAESDQRPSAQQREQRERPAQNGDKPGSEGESRTKPTDQSPATGQDSKGQSGQPKATDPNTGAEQGNRPGANQTNGEQPQESTGSGEGPRQVPSAQPGSSGATGNPSAAQGMRPQEPGTQASPDGAPKGNAPESGQKSPDPKGLERAARELRRLADGDGQQGKERARQLHEMAKKMLEESTPEQREQVRKLAQEFGRQTGAGGPGAGRSPLTMGQPSPPGAGLTTPVDARRPATVSGNDKPPERTIAEWYSDKPAERGQAGAVPADVLRQAADGAERAIEQQQVPGRYQDLVRRVFRRYAEQAPPR